MKSCSLFSNRFIVAKRNRNAYTIKTIVNQNKERLTSLDKANSSHYPQLALTKLTCYINTMIQANNINEVITHLDSIIVWSKQHQSRIGYFATLYRKMTIAVQQGIANNSFKDGKRMELLDVIFANRYLHAWEAYVNKQPCTNAWCAAFNACNQKDLIVLQHLLLGINTHINLDLGIAAAEACPGDKIFDLQSDFEKINDVIAVQTNNVQETLCKVWFPLRALMKISNNREKAVLNFSTDAARKCSWANAVALSIAAPKDRDNYIHAMDNTVVKLANRIIHPGFEASFMLKPVLLMEDKNVAALIDMLKD